MEVLSKDIHPMDQIELHKKPKEMVYSTLADKALLAQKLQNSLHNTSTQLELEKASSLAKDNIIKSLEEIIIELGHDPNDPKGIQALIRKKEEDIAALKMQLKLSIAMHPQTIEVAQQKAEDDMMGLLTRRNERLTETEQALEKAMKEKQGLSTSQPPETTPTTTTIVPPTVPTTSTLVTDTSAVATTTVPDTSMSMEKMMKEIKELEFQMAELKEAKEKLAKFEVSYDKSKITVAEKTREVKAWKIR